MPYRASLCPHKLTGIDLELLALVFSIKMTEFPPST